MFFRSLLSFILLSVPLISQGQENFFAKPDKNGRDKFFYGGVVIGLNACQIDGDNYSGFHKAGLNTGVSAYIKLNPKLVLNLELLYSQKGAKNVNVINTVNTGTTPIMYTAKLNYAEIPLTLNYYVGQRIYLGAGFSYGRLVSDKEFMDSYTSSAINTLQNTFRRQDINYLASISYQLYANIFVRARYQYSVMSIRDAQKIPIEFGTSRQFNNLFALQLINVF